MSTTINGTKCCAKCKTPYGHSAEAGRCCHPVLVSAYQTLADVETARSSASESAVSGREDER